jgi:hypothetical protein
MRIEAAHGTVEQRAAAQPASERAATRTGKKDAAQARSLPAAGEEFRPPRPPEPQPHALRVQVDESGDIYYRLMDAQTGEVVREIPAEEIRRVIRQVAAMQKALEKAHAVDLKA